MEDPRLSTTFCIVEALNFQAEEAFSNLEHNQQYVYQPDAAERPPKTLRRTQRDTTPIYSYQTGARLLLTIRPESFHDPARGLVFGVNTDHCDVQLDRTTANGVSGIHFSLNFAWDEEPSPSVLLLKNLSRNGTKIGDVVLRGTATRMLDLQGISRVRAGGIEMAFQIYQPVDRTKFYQAWASFLAGAKDALPHISGLRARPMLDPTPHMPLTAAKEVVGPPARRELRSQKGSATNQRGTRPSDRMTASDESSACTGGTPVSRKRKQTGAVSTSTYVLIRPLAENDSRSVKLFALSDSARQVVVKTYYKRKQQLHAKHIREILIAKKLQHEHIVSFLHTVDHEHTLEIHMRYIPGGSLQAYVEDKAALTHDKCARLLDQILDALEYLETIPLVHRDIKPLNVMIASNHPMVFKLIDFDLACDPSATDYTRSTGTVCGTPYFLPPEINALYHHVIPRQHGQSLMTQALDIWSLGATAWFAATESHVYDSAEGPPIAEQEPRRQKPGPSEMETVIEAKSPTVTAIRQAPAEPSPGRSATSQASRLELGDFAIDLRARHKHVKPGLRVSELGMDLMESMMNIVREARPTAAACRRHKWIAEGLAKPGAWLPH